MDSSLVEHFAVHGWAVFPDVVDTATLSRAMERLQLLYPSFDAYHANPERYPELADGQFGGVRLWPVDDLELDLLSLNAGLVALAQELIGKRDIRLLRGGYQAKYAGTVDFDQVLHYDYPNHTLVVPMDNDVIGFFLYLSDVTDDLGPTALVSDAVRGDVTPGRTHLDPSAWPELYAVEQRATGLAGTVLAYRATTYHRGTAIEAHVGTRLTLSYAFAQPSPWTGYASFPRLGEEQGLIRAMAAMTPRQRELLGFPPVGDAYWTPANVAAVAQRYPGFDPSPYIAEGSVP